MPRAPTLAAIATVVVLGVVTACGDAEPEADRSPRESQEPPDTEPEVDGPVEPPAESAMEQTIAGLWTFAGEFGTATIDDGQNAVFSPVSIAYAFAMLRAGATDETVRQLDEVFGFPAGEVHAVMHQMSQDVVTTDEPPPRTDEGATREGDQAPADPIVAIANGLFVADGVRVGSQFAETLSQYYAAAAEEVDFAGGQAKETIDRWVAEQTVDRIQELFDEIAPATVAVLANAVYLKAEWEHQFEEHRTSDDAFRLTDATTVDVPMMSMKPTELNVVAGEGWQAVELPYAGGTMTMWVVVPDDVDAPPPRLGGETLAALDGGQLKHVELTMPRWDFGTDAALLPVLDGLGLTDLSGLSGIAPGFFVTDAIHRANITVDEAGTEAAAVTGIAGATSEGPEPEITIRADHPFSFAITDTATGAPLFVGSIADPSRG